MDGIGIMIRHYSALALLAFGSHGLNEKIVSEKCGLALVKAAITVTLRKKISYRIIG